MESKRGNGRKYLPVPIPKGIYAVEVTQVDLAGWSLPDLNEEVGSGRGGESTLEITGNCFNDEFKYNLYPSP